MKHIKTLAIVDDDEIFVFLTKKAIEKIDLAEHVKVFGNGLDAINFLKENADHPVFLPQIIILDLFMPIMDGWQFLEKFALLKYKFEKKIIIYVVSSSISPEDMKRAKSINDVSDFIIKPITKEKLVDIVKKF